MEPPKIENKGYKKVFAIKGNLLKKVKDKLFSGEIKDSTAATNEAVNKLNNNDEAKPIPYAKESLKSSSENKIVIQKVESVKIDVSPWFNPSPNTGTRFESISDDAIPKPVSKENGATKTGSVEMETRSSSSKLMLKAKYPDNQLNTKIPLKMIRTVKAPLPIPNLRNRYHRVETHKSETPKKIPKLETKEVVAGTIENESMRKGSDSEEDFEGFASGSETIHLDIYKLNDFLKSSTASDKQTSKIKQEDTVKSEFPVKEEFAKQSGAITFVAEMKSTAIQDLRRSTRSASQARDSSQSESRARDSSQYESRARDSSQSDHDAGASESKRYIRPIPTNLLQPKDVIDKLKSSETPEVKEEKCGEPKKKSRKGRHPVVQTNVGRNTRSHTSSYSEDADLSFAALKEADKTSPKPAKWTHDIAIVIGQQRIEQIDRMLKDIPVTMMGNAIETENVELKLIVNHLLRKLGVETVAETLQQEKGSNMLSEESSNDDFDDDFPDSFGEDFSGQNNFSSAGSQFAETDKEEPTKPSKRKHDRSNSTLKQPATKKAKVASDTLAKSQEATCSETDLGISFSEAETKTTAIQILRRSTRSASRARVSDQSDQDASASEPKRSQEKSLEPMTSEKLSTPPLKFSSGLKLKLENPTPRRMLLRSSSSESGLEYKRSESDSGPSRPCRKRKTLLSSSSSVDQKSSEMIRKEVKRKNHSPMKKTSKNDKAASRKTLSKIIDSDTDSESDHKTLEKSRKEELKSCLGQLDSNSKRKSSILIVNDYSKPSDKNKNVDKETSILVGKLTSTISKTKKSDPTYVDRPTTVKRERLRSSAFNGNKDCSSDQDNQEHSEQDTRTPSVSRASSFEDKEKKKTKKNPQVRIKTEPGKVKMKIFDQEKLSTANENLVPYNKILQALRTSAAPKKIGRMNAKTKQEIEDKQKEDEKALRALTYFRCGACHFDVTKHRWINHFKSHGGHAWIEGFEPPIVKSDWNECVRRTINNGKYYEITAFICPNCQHERVSALGHLTHSFVCGEDEADVEKMKPSCDLCKEKIFPFNATAHKKSCQGRQKLQEEDDGDDESGSSDEKTPEFFSASGRKKRQAVRRAETNIKKSGHIKKEPTDSESDGEFTGGSESEIEFKGNALTETEGSSGVDSSEVESSNSEPEDDEDNNVSSKKVRQPYCEAQEGKNGRAVLAEFVESLRNSNLSSKLFNWTKQFVDENWKNEIMPKLLPKYNLNIKQDAKIALAMINFKQESLNFGALDLDRYNQNYEQAFRKDWKQLRIGEASSNKTSETIYCGGSVSAIDWAPGNGDLNFLAVACNNSATSFHLNLKQTSQSTVQLYEFKNLVNDKFSAFNNSSKLCYVIIINDGPIWSIKFHSNECCIEKRLGILAVATANQSVSIYSLPYLNNVNSIVLPLEPNLICKLDDNDTLFNDEYLLQVSKVTWFQKNGKDSILAAGYISGAIALWNVSSYDNASSKTLFPHHVIQAHLEPVSSLDFKATTGADYHLLTASFDRKIKVFTFNEVGYEETASSYSLSRCLCAEWWMNWPGYLLGYDECFTSVSLAHHQPLEFTGRNSHLISIGSSITNLSINHWLNFAMFVTDSGDVMGCHPNQMLNIYPKDRWQYFNFQIIASTDYNKIAQNDGNADKIGVLFGDYKTNTSQRKKFRQAPTDRVSELQINQVCFNRNEKSHRFFAFGYETGFVRIKFLKIVK